MTLYIKHRPTKLSDIVGNENVIETLESIMARKEGPPHAFLLTGPSGCGKTTLARILADMVGATGIDFTEMDSASFRGIDTIRELRKNSRLAPMQGKARAYLLDECHQLSKDAMSALLKELEDTPSHVYYFLTTTNPEKLLSTIKNRASHFQVNPLDDDEMEVLLKSVCKAEGKLVKRNVKEEISDVAEGSPRKALVLLDKVIDLDEKAAVAILGQTEEEEKQIIDLCRALIADKRPPWKVVAGMIKQIKDEPESIRRAVLGYCSSVLLNGKSDRAYLVMDAFRDNFYDSSRAGVVLACYEIYNTE